MNNLSNLKDLDDMTVASSVICDTHDLNNHIDFNNCNLTIHARLFFLARDLAKSKIYKYCWTSFGRVFVRKDDTSKIVCIQSEAQVHRLLQET